MVETDGKMQYAESEDGQKFFGKLFISNMHPHKTMEITSSEMIKKVFRNRVKGLENTISTFYVNVVLKKNTFKYQNRNYYHFAGDDAWGASEYTLKTGLKDMHYFTLLHQIQMNMAERLFDFVEKKIPGFKDTIKSYYVATPLTSRD